MPSSLHPEGMAAAARRLLGRLSAQDTGTPLSQAQSKDQKKIKKI
jgi:hypothetical protein